MGILFRNILTASFHGSIVILAVIVLRLFLKKAPKKFLCFLWLLVGLRLLLPFEIQSPVSLQPENTPMDSIRWEHPVPEASPLHLPGGWEETAEAAAETIQQLPQSAGLATQDPAENVAAIVPWFWFAVAAAIMAYSMTAYLRLRKQVREAIKIPGGWECDRIDTAFVLGFVKPQIYIPMGMPRSLQKYILAHERTHIEKGDQWFKLIGFLALAIHWFNPLVWIAYVLMCRDIEIACDERVVQFMELSERKAYSAALLQCSTNKIHYAACPVAFGEVSVKYRIQSVLNYRKPSFWISLFAVAAILFVTVCLITSPTAQSEEAGAAPTLMEALLPEREPEFIVPTAPDFGEEFPWALDASMEASTPTGGVLTLKLDRENWDGIPLHTETAYTMDRWNGSTWEPLSLLVKEPQYSGYSKLDFSEDNLFNGSVPLDLDWSLIYGALPEGDYRIVMPVDHAEETRDLCAWFHIYTNSLTDAQQAVIDRCTDGLSILTQREYYAATVYKTNEEGQLYPSYAVWRCANHMRRDDYLGNLIVNSFPGDSTDFGFADWEYAFRLDGNKTILFPEGIPKAEESTLRFRACWAEPDGTAYQQDYTWCFDDSGLLQSVDILTSHDQDGETLMNQKRLEVGSVSYGEAIDYIQSLESAEIKDSFTAANESSWGIFFRVEDDVLTASGSEVWLALNNTIGVSNYTTDSHYWLERKSGIRWEPMESVSPSPSWGSDTYQLQGKTTVVDVSWEEEYGKLAPGVYRMGKQFYKGSDSLTQYAEFAIFSDGTIVGEGGEEAIARVRAAIDKVCNSNYKLTHYYSPGSADRMIESVEWKYNGQYVYDAYMGDFQHSILLTDPNDFMWDSWQQNFLWDGPYAQLYFAEGASRISDTEITFAQVFKGCNPDDIWFYSFYFDESGNLTRILRDGSFSDVSGVHPWYSEFIIEDVPEAEIQEHVEAVAANPDNK